MLHGDRLDCSDITCFRQPSYLHGLHLIILHEREGCSRHTMWYSHHSSYTWLLAKLVHQDLT